MAALLYLISLSSLSVLLHCSASPLQTMSTGSSLRVEEYEQTYLTSPDNTFSCGFHPSGRNAFSFSIWFTHATNQAVVWTANSDSLVNGQGSKISLNRDGNLVLTDVNGSTVWDSKTSWGKGTTVALLDTGNLVIRASGDSIVWESFNSPTDTLLPLQRLTRNNRLTSKYHDILHFADDNVLRLLYDGPETSSVYWPGQDYSVLPEDRTRFNSTKIAVLDNMGSFTSSDGFKMKASDSGPGIKRRITLDYDGNFRMYSLNASTGNWTVTAQAILQMCYVHGLCGKHGICEYSPGLRCRCPPGYEMTDPEDWNKGCRPTFDISCSQSHVDFKFVKIPHGDFYGFDLTNDKSISFESCMQICLDSCRCSSFTYIAGEGLCYTKAQLYIGRVFPYFRGDNYLKLPQSTILASSVSKQHGLTCRPKGSDKMLRTADMYGTNQINWVYFYFFAAILGVLQLLFIGTGWYFLFNKQTVPKSMEEGYKMITNQFRRFTYAELKEATGKFKEELGRGGSGIVYRGVLEDKKVVAVKKLADLRQGEEEFWAEVTLIGRINHINLVRMWGFCSEGKHRLLVYEYVENESMDKHLFGHVITDRLLGWSQRFKIALGTARGLAYLHHECLEWVVHCDVKPENILLTRDFEAKIADFGLAKLSQRGNSCFNVSHMRGTTGYMAPEWAGNLPINAKVDVYSYGIVLLEIVTGRRVSSGIALAGEEIVTGSSFSSELDGTEMESMQLVQQVKHILASGDNMGIVDARLGGNFNPEQAMAMVKIAVSCLEERSKRPTMDEIVKDLMMNDDNDHHPAYAW